MNEAEAVNNAVIFILEGNPAERERIRAVVIDMGCAALPLDSLDAIVTLLENGAECDLVILAADALNDDPARFDRIAAAGGAIPPIILCGMDRRAKVVLHGLNKGVYDFIAKPVDADELAYAVETAIGKTSGDASWRHPDAIVGSSPVGGWVELTASSELEQFRRLQRFSDALFASRLPKKICEDLKMAVEEVGRNAVEWGNNFDPNKQVRMSYCIFADRVIIKVQDEGDGFKPGLIPDPTVDPMKTMRDRMNAGKRPGGYGVYLIQKLVDDIFYNEKGNTVLLIKRLPGDARGEA